MGFFNNIGRFFGGSRPKAKSFPVLRPDQMDTYKQLIGSSKGAGAGGAFGQSADYYRDLLSNDPQEMDSFNAPAMRQYFEQIVPNISEQFAGMGSGALSSSGFRNAQVQGGVDLAERLANIRANLRQNAAQGLFNTGQASLGNFNRTVMSPGSQGFLPSVAQGLGSIGGMWLGGKIMGGGMGAGTAGGLGSNEIFNAMRG